MSVVNRDYIERMIEEAGQALAVVIQLIKAGEFSPALIMIQKTSDLVLGRLRPVLERLDPASAVEMVGPLEMDRIRIFAALLGEEGAIHEARGHADRSLQCCRRALELYGAIALAGAPIKLADQERIASLLPKVGLDQVDERYRAVLGRLSVHGTAIEPTG